MTLLEDILQWTETLPLWQRDAARRLFQQPEGLSKDDYTELYALLKAAHNLPNPKGLMPVPLSKTHLPSSPAGGDSAILKGMRDLKHVNCIAPQQNLTFEPSGITLIYGDNGSGKSGYARVMKRACRSRDLKQQVLPDANDPGEQGCIPEAVFDIEVNGTAKSVHWCSDADSPEELAHVAVFDCHCARVYLTSEQEVAYLPYGLDIAEALANEVLPQLDSRLHQEIDGINTDSQPFAHLPGDTEVGQLAADLNYKTDTDKLSVLATLSDEELERINELDGILGEAKPAEKAKQLRLSAMRLKELATRIESSIPWVDDKAVERLKATVQESAAADQAERAVAKAMHSGEVLLPGTGEPVWKALFEAARKFSTEQAYPEKIFPNTEDGALCVLCQQPLQDAGKRLERFEKYVQEDVAKNAAAKRRLLSTEVDSIRRAELTVGTEGAIGEELDQLDVAASSLIKAFDVIIEERRGKLLDAVRSNAWDSIPAIVSSPRQRLRDLAAGQYRKARDYERASDERKIAVLRKEREALVARERLSQCIDQLLALISRLRNKKALEDCEQDLETRPISMKLREFASQAVTSALKDALDEEFAALNMGHLNTKLKERNVKGRVMHQLLLDVPTSSKVEEILSEGEQRAIALGSFMAELRLAEHSAAIVFDDPTCSLDHKRRKRIAKRLATESRKRQVIIYTHDIVFLHQLQSQCALLGLSLGLRYLEKIKDSSGIVSRALPWDHKGYKERIDCLGKKQKAFEKLPWPPEPHEELAREMILQYSLLRATIERVVQDFVLNATVRRFEDYIRVDNLKQVVRLEDSDVVKICSLYRRCSDITEAHDKASVKNDPPPTAEELGRDIDALKTLIQAIKYRRNS